MGLVNNSNCISFGPVLSLSDPENEIVLYNSFNLLNTKRKLIQVMPVFDDSYLCEIAGKENAEDAEDNLYNMVIL